MFEYNLELIQKHYRPYYDIIKNYPGGDIYIEETVSRDGALNLKAGKDGIKLFLHSSYNTSGEAKRWVNTVDPDEKIVLILGGGCFYHIEELRKQDRNSRTIIVVEPSLDVFIKVLHNIDMKKYLEDPNLIIFLSDNPDEISEGFFKILFNKGIQSFGIYSLMSYKQLFNRYYLELRQRISELIKIFDVNLVTEVVWGQRWVYNQLRNLRNINENSCPLAGFTGQFKGVPAVIAGAGPSLEKQLDLLKENQDKFFLFSAGSSVNILDSYGIEPHIQVAIDGGEGEDRIIGSIKNKKTKLAFFPTLSHGSLERFKGKKIWFKGNMYSMVDYMGKYTGLEMDTVEMGPSCVHSAMDIAIKLGCSPIILVGQDMAYTNEQLYAKGAVLYDTVNTDERTRVLKKDIYGKDIYTNSAFWAIKLYFESYVRTRPEVELINCTEGGLGITGVENAGLKEVLRQLEKLDKNIDQMLEDKFNTIRNELIVEGSLAQKTDDFVKHVAKEAREMLEKSEKRLGAINELLENFKSLGIQKIKDEIEVINKMTDDIEACEVHSEIMRFSVAGYYLAVRHNTHEQIENVTELREKYRLILMGLQKQFFYYHAIVQSLISSVEDSEIQERGA